MRPIFLIGYMSSGKTTLGRVLARQMNCEFIDLDYFIEGRFRKTVKEIFAERGEAGFRKIEHNMLCEISEFQDVIIACGGGTPCFFDNMEIMNTNGLTIHLHAPTDIICARLSLPGSKAKRPVIADKSDEELRAFVEKSIADRAQYYTRAAMDFDTTQIETAAETETTAAVLVKKIKEA